MISIVVWTLVALGAASLVMVIASASTGETSGIRSFPRDLRAGLNQWRARGTAAPIAAEPEPLDSTFDEFFAAAEVDDEPYLQVDDLADTLTRAKDRAARAGRTVATRSANLVRR